MRLQGHHGRQCRRRHRHPATTMNSPPFASEPTPSSAFTRLHPNLQRWVHEQGWTTLHDAQEQAIGPIIDGECDVIIAAATAAGKTEAAFLPILSALASTATNSATSVDTWTAHDPWAEPVTVSAVGVQVLYLSPLKALINDQFDRLEQMCERADVPVHRWHGDVSDSAKRKVRDNPSGVLLITPESLEATFVNRGTAVPRMFAGLRYIVVDELHSFLATPRGAQLQSLMSRVELAIRRRTPRIGLSATLGDMGQAAAFLRPAHPEQVHVISSTADSRALQLQLRGYVATQPAMSQKEAQLVGEAGQEVAVEDVTTGDRLAIAAHMFDQLRGKDNLVFANSRRDVETYADLLARRSDAERLPNEFWPHHGSLSKEMRETVEAQLKDRTMPATAVCTSTLEMGIDIGSVSSVAQIGPPPTVASLRQRLGRSGRRDEPAVLRLYVSDKELDERSHPVEELRCSIVQATAMVHLMLERWVESPDDPGFNYSTLVQQVLSTIAQHGGATAVDLHRALCGPGPFGLVDQTRFVRLLRAMAAAELVMQTSDGLLLSGPVGDRHVNHYGFYTAFNTEQEWRLTTGGRTLGTVPISQPLYDGVLLIFAGKRWRVTGIDTQSRVVDLERSSGGNPPMFGGAGMTVSDRVRSRMVAVYQSTDLPPWVDRPGGELLREGRAAWARLGLAGSSVVQAGGGTLVFPWVGDRALFTASLALLGEKVEALVEGPALQIFGVNTSELGQVLENLCDQPRPTASHLARLIENRDIDKWDWVLDDTLGCESAGARLLDIDGAWEVFERTRHDLRIPQPVQPAVTFAAASFAPPSFAAPAGAPLPVLAHPSPANGTEIVPAEQPKIAYELRRPDLLTQEFCVIDVETTGFSPRLGDRVLEIAAVRVRGDGTVLSEWSTLVNPRRDVGATHVHGITASDVADAPEFSKIVGDLLEHIDGAVLVAHNFRFDRYFIAAEFDRAGHLLPTFPAVCTLSLGAHVHSGGASRRLDACCKQLGIELPDAHDALCDARAASQILVRYLAMAVQAGHRTLDDIGCVPLEWPTATYTVKPTRQRHQRGGIHQRIEHQGDYLAGLVGRLDTSSDGSADNAAYLDLLDRALEDRRLTATEADTLAVIAQDWGLSTDEVKAVHDRYFDSLLAVATADGVITDLEYHDLQLVGALLRLDRDDVERRINDVELAAPSDRPASESSFAGLSVCFTGALVGRIDGDLITREEAHQFAEQAGLIVKTGVTKGLDLLVVADPDTQSGKARKAADYGTRVIAEQVFWSVIGVATD
jgi:ATP-dependent Lhr-like helicase